MTNQFYSTKELSVLCAVAETTVKRWSNMGLIRHHKTLGGHRKFKLDDVLEFVSKNNIAIASSQIEKLTTEKKYAENLDLGTEILFIKRDTEKLSQRLLDHLLAFKKSEAETLLVKAYEEGFQFSEIFDRIIAPAMYEIGVMWMEKRLGVGEEHIMTNIVIESILRLKLRYETAQSRQKASVRELREPMSVLPVPQLNAQGGVALQEPGEVMRTEQGRSMIICTCPNSELHEVALLGVSLVCQQLGFEVNYVGASAPFKDLEHLVESRKPRAVCMSITMAGFDAAQLKRFETFKRFLKNHGVRLIIGGQFIGERKTRPINADFRARTCGDLEQYLRENFDVD